MSDFEREMPQGPYKPPWQKPLHDPPAKPIKDNFDYWASFPSKYDDCGDFAPRPCPVCQYGLREFACRVQGFILGVLASTVIGAACWAVLR